ncbi:MAG: hypothetical protein ABI680_04470 [Chthoniobacteraceae bacterium]
MRKNLRAHNLVTFDAETSIDLEDWNGGDSVVFVSETNNGDGTATILWRSATPMNATFKEYMRLRISQ